MSQEEQPQSEQSPREMDILVNRVETYTREEPVKSISAAFGVGILLTLLPLGGVIAGLSRIVFVIARPILMLLGLLKVADELNARRARAQAGESHRPTEPEV